MTFPVKWYDSAMEGAPLLSSGSPAAAHTTNPGSLIELLKAILVTGFGVKAVSSAVYDSQAATITLTVAAGHKFLKDQIIELSGANEANFNGEYRVTAITSTTVVVGLDNGTPAASSATGTLSMKIPSLGWEVEYEDAGTYRCIFKRTDAEATGLRLYVDNSAWSGWNNSSGYLAKVAMVEDVVAIDNFTTVYEHRWPCSHSYANSEWQAFGDGCLLYFLPQYGNARARAPYAFGDMLTNRAGDQYHCLLIHYPGLTNDSSREWNNSSEYYYNDALKFGDSSEKRLARSYHQLPGSVSAYWKGLASYFGEGMSYPNPSDNGFYVSTEPVPVFDDLSYRGSLPGVVVPYATATGYDKTHLDNLPGLPDKLIRLLLCNREETAGTSRLIGFDIKGPWR